ncbi:DUF417 family protein [Chitinophaga sp. S165]|uniref:DUF417 family protein n=1 Tax=Chitinophaga sp. S165 TaxID=2135462 RepID=UPI000D7132E7|nr:DUF417 family protein [Chitinophaga sp. S165]PWV56354.1 putative membrane protein YkgB [Chitinophaga sp. S165]
MKHALILTQDMATASTQPSTRKNLIVRLAQQVGDLNLPFLFLATAMAVMLLWAGSYKMTNPGAEGIVPLVTNSPLISWHFKFFGPYIGSDLIGLTEITAAVLILIGLFKPKAGIVGGFIGVVMFFVTSTMVITTPDAITHVNGMGYLSFMGLFLFKDLIALGASLYLISYFGKKAINEENKGK